MKWCLTARQPFSFKSVIRSHGWIDLAPFHYENNSEKIWYTASLESEKVVDIGLEEAPGGVGVEVSNPLNETEKAEISTKVDWMLGLDRDFSTFYDLARAEPKLKRVLEMSAGRILRCPMFFEDIVKTILTTNTQWGGTKRMVANLVNLYGRVISEEDQYHAFPSPKQLAAVGSDDLRSDAKLGYRAPYISELSHLVASGELDVEKYKKSNLRTSDLRKKLREIKGVGGYAAANLLMILGRYDDIPVDSWALKMVSHEWFNGEPIGPSEVEAKFKTWGEWKGLVFWFWNWSFKE